jgi:beta-lactamase class D
MRLTILLGLLACSVCFAATATAYTLQEVPELQEHFRASGYTGCFAMLDPVPGTVVTSDVQCAVQELPPASTFKIAHTLIALETGVHNGMDATLPWDGTDRGIAAWNQDLTMEQALQASAVWFYEETARRIGRERMHDWLRRLRYTNADTTGPSTTYWLDSGLRVTALDQLYFLHRLQAETLPVDREHIRAVKAALVLEQRHGRTLSAKTGWAQQVSPQVGWLAGYVEQGDTAWPFALWITAEEPGKGFGRARMELGKACLGEMGVWEE